MKKWILLAAVCSLPLLMMAQDDDMYFVPTKENVAKEAETWGMPKKTYYSGSNRSVDDYNGRLSSTVTPIDSLGKEVETDDYKYTRQLSRFDDYTPSQAYWEGYRDGRWTSPWYYGRYGWYSTWYDPWYISWYDPWYSSWYDPWYDSWYYGSYGYYGYYGWASPWRYGWYTPIYYYGGRGHKSTAHDRFHANRNVSGSSSFGNGFGRANGGSNRGGFGASRNNNNNRSTSSSRTFGTSRNSTGFGSNSRSNSNSTFGSSRSSSNSSFGTSRSSSSSSSGGGSGGGSFGGGSRSGGGGGRFGR